MSWKDDLVARLRDPAIPTDAITPTVLAERVGKSANWAHRRLYAEFKAGRLSRARKPLEPHQTAAEFAYWPARD